MRRWEILPYSLSTRGSPDRHRDLKDCVGEEIHDPDGDPRYRIEKGGLQTTDLGAQQEPCLECGHSAFGSRR